jgi:hypothetical protein
MDDRSASRGCARKWGLELAFWGRVLQGPAFYDEWNRGLRGPEAHSGHRAGGGAAATGQEGGADLPCVLIHARPMHTLQKVISCIELASVVTEQLAPIGNVDKQRVVELCTEFLENIKASLPGVSGICMGTEGPVGFVPDSPSSTSSPLSLCHRLPSAGCTGAAAGGREEGRGAQGI